MDYIRWATNALSNIFASDGYRPQSNQPSVISTDGTLARHNLPDSTDIIRISLLLRQKLPADIVPLVLDFAELWSTVLHVSSPRPDRVGELQAPKLQAALIVPSHIPRGAVRRIRFITDSRDQGWSDYQEDHNTYRGSWTWFEAGVRGFDPDLESDPMILNAPVDCRHHNALDTEHRLCCMQRNELYKYGSKRIVTNLHAAQEFQRHVVEWDISSPDEVTQKILGELKGGHRIEVAAHARFPGWCNYIRSVEIEIECAVVRRM